MTMMANRVILSNREQLKCNLCTEWFTVDSEFAQLQKYSLNACSKCFQQFHHTVVHPKTLEVHELAFIKTGILFRNDSAASQKKIQED